MKNIHWMVALACGVVVLSLTGMVSRFFIGQKASVDELDFGPSGTYLIEGFIQETREFGVVALSDGSGAITLDYDRNLKHYKNIEVINPKRKGMATITKSGNFLVLQRWVEYPIANNLSRKYLGNDDHYEPLTPDGLEERTLDSYIAQDKRNQLRHLFDDPGY